MSDTRPLHGIPRPDPAALIQADDITVACLEQRTWIRAQFAAAHDRVSLWTVRDLT